MKSAHLGEEQEGQRERVGDQRGTEFEVRESIEIHERTGKFQ